MSDELAGKTVVISGGARGQGASHADRLAGAGARVLVTDIRDELGEKVVAGLAEQGHDARYRHLDVRSTEDWAAAIGYAESEFGSVDVLVNNAGIVGTAPADKCSDEEWSNVVGTNLTGIFKGVRAAVPAMRRAGGGSIVNVSSVFGVKGSWGYAAYVASKAGVVGLTKSAALTYSRENIRINAIAPSSVETPMLDEEREIWKDNPDWDFDEWMASQPIPRVARPAEVSELVLYLASSASSYCTGAVYPIDGGILAG